MTKNYLLSVCLISMITSWVQAQNCGVYFPLEANATYEFKLYRGTKPFGKLVYQVKSVESGKGTMKITQLKENGKPLPPEFQTGYTILCNTKNVRIKPDSTDLALLSMGGLTLPSNLREGSIIPKATTTYYHKDHPERKVGTVELYNFVVTKGSVTVPTGTFEALVIEYDFFNIGLANFTHPKKFHRKEWYVPGKGLVKFERETNLGSLNGELTSVKME